MLRLKALGDIFFAVDLKFPVEIELFSTENFSIIIYSTVARNTWKCSANPKLNDAEGIVTKNSNGNFIFKNFQNYHFFIESPLS